MKRQPAVAGLFYPDRADQLKNAVLSYLGASPNHGLQPKAMIAPHAGYIYSAPIAGHGYSQIKHNAHKIKRVILLGPSHRVPFYGLAVPDHKKFTTPLGDTAIDETTVKALVDARLAKYLNEAHQLEHSLEVHLPFLQTILQDFTIVPIVVGQCDAAEVSQAIDAVWGGEETLIIVSSDLSHYLPYAEANELDGNTATAIENYDVDAIKQKQACGATPIRGLLRSAKQRGLNVSRLALCNSGDTAGSKDSVVGYGTFVFTE